MDHERFPRIVQQLYTLAAELETMFPGRHFTPDGHMVGSLGEALAAYYYGLTLLPASTRGRDAKKGDRSVEIKATLSNRAALRHEPEVLLVLKLSTSGSFDEVYNGDGRRVWDAVKLKPLPSNGQYQISLAKLAQLNGQVAPSERLPRVVT